MRVYLVLSIVTACLAGCGDDVANPQVDAIQKVFGQYKQAVVNKDGQSAANCVTTATLDEHDRWLRLCRSATKAELQGQPVLDRMQVLTMRIQIPKDILLKVDGRGLFAYGIKQDWMPRDGLAQMRIDDVKVTGNKANTAVFLGKQQAPIRYEFLKDKDGWKLNMLATMQVAAETLDAHLASTGGDHNAYILRQLKVGTGQPVDDSVWEPIGE